MRYPRSIDSHLFVMSVSAMAVSSINPASSFLSSLVQQRNHQSCACLVNSSTESISLTVNRLLMDDVATATKLFTRAFPRTAKHSWSRALGLNRTLDGYMSTYLPTHIQNPHLGCFAARTTISSSTELVGALLLEYMPTSIDPNARDNNGDVANDKDGDSTTENQDEATLFAYSAIDGLMNECRNIFHRQLQEKHGISALEIKCGYVAWIAVEERYRGIGIASAMIRHGDQLFKKSGCRYSVAFAMSPTSTHVFQQNGYERWGYVTYQDYELDGKRPFGILSDELSVMVKDLECIKDYDY